MASGRHNEDLRSGSEREALAISRVSVTAKSPGVRVRLEEEVHRQERQICSSCEYYDADRRYCTYLQLPAPLLFTCPLNLNAPK
ncbi:hypothetical protein FGU65_13290 [Methanoculleus sp. FWC-SCC1]|uniref:Uncharacterized protein n=1 Tax=Methanoculleus frigidifontis TaxID=2584085 RepID=A0ABT8MD12_9EURY|nr:hypothetical protein [Methanoculleus sp. FWC-SCC1]MDN7025842.1 hypothetical protein [Methanoculleus sp. FWC-SCC1]